jgi:hypothetical protein
MDTTGAVDGPKGHRFQLSEEELLAWDNADHGFARHPTSAVPSRGGILAKTLNS